MEVKLLHHTPLWVASTAIRKCWASEDKSDSYDTYLCRYCGSDNIDIDLEDVMPYCCKECGRGDIETGRETGPKDKELIYRIGNKNKHASTLEHLNYSFDIDGISRACLQELARHRHASMSVKSTRYTLKELKEAPRDLFSSFLVSTADDIINTINERRLLDVQDALREGLSNDQVKYMLPEAYKTSLVWTVNARSLQNFLVLRTNKAALWEIRELAYEIFNQLPEEHKYLFEEFLYVEEG